MKNDSVHTQGTTVSLDAVFELMKGTKDLERFMAKLNQDGALAGLDDTSLEKLLETYRFRRKKNAPPA